MGLVPLPTKLLFEHPQNASNVWTLLGYCFNVWWQFSGMSFWRCLKQLRLPAHRSNYWKGTHTQIMSAPHNKFILCHAPLLLCHNLLVSSRSGCSWRVLVWACKTICIWYTTAEAVTIRPMTWGATVFEACADQLISDLSCSATLKLGIVKLALHRFWRQFVRKAAESSWI